jgi:hypothetical protein
MSFSLNLSFIFGHYYEKTPLFDLRGALSCAKQKRDITPPREAIAL